MWICPTYSTKGKAACSSKRIPENILITATLEVVGTLDALDGKITAVRVEKDNTLVFCEQQPLNDGRTAPAPKAGLRK